MLTLEEISADRQRLHQRWYAEGHFAASSFGDKLQLTTCQFADVRIGFHNARGLEWTKIGNIWAHATDIARGFQSIGIGPGNAVVIQMPLALDTAATYLALLSIGATIVPALPAFGVREIEFILTQSKARVLIMPDRLRSTDYLARVGHFAALPGVEHIVIAGEAAVAGTTSLAELAIVGKANDRALPSVDPDSVCVIIYTSGTTSDPKGVQHTHNSLLADLRSPLFHDRGLFLNLLPTGHIGGLLYLLRPFLLGVSQIFMDQWVPETAASIIAAEQVREISATPVFLLKLLEVSESGGYDLSSIQFFGVGGASVAPDHIRLAQERGFESGRGYGSSEHPVVSTSLLGAPFEKRAFTDGAVTYGNEVRIVDDDGKDLPVGEAGEIVSRGPGMFVGYTDLELNQEAYLSGGWYRSGDIGRLDADGYVTVTDRKKDIIIRGGENISSKEVEEILAKLDPVAEAAVIAAPDPMLGERICAFVRLRAKQALTLEMVQAHFASSQVARHKTPEKLVEVEDFPRTASGKIQKFALRKLLQDKSGASA